MTTVYLIRHAEAEGNLYRRAHGHYDSTITARGYQQIAALAKRFASEPIDAVYASDLARARTTALSITRTHRLPLHTTERLREVGMGAWEDKTWAYLARFERPMLLKFNTDAGNWHVAGGQDMAGVRDRMLGALREIVGAHPDQTVAIFSHGMALRLLTGTLQGLSIAQIDGTPHGENTAVTKLEADETGIRTVYRDDASHIPDELSTVRRQLWTKTEGGIEPGVWFAPDPEREGRFDVMREGACVGGVGVGSIADGVADIEEFWIDEDEQGKDLGIRLVGQALSHARAHGCDTLRCLVPRDNPLGLRRAAEYGFAPALATPSYVAYELYFGCDEGYRAAKFEEALAEQK